jgi:hypothetical protein
MHHMELHHRRAGRRGLAVLVIAAALSIAGALGAAAAEAQVSAPSITRDESPCPEPGIGVLGHSPEGPCDANSQPTGGPGQQSG